jgi:hypothetical protein
MSEPRQLRNWLTSDTITCDHGKQLSEPCEECREWAESLKDKGEV